MSRRVPTPLRSAPSSGPMEAMAAKKQEQIEELITKKRTLEHTIDKLRQALTEEQSRGSDAVASMQKQFQQERAEWISGCDAIQAIHRMAHARTVIELDREHFAALKEREAIRLEKLARLQRDYRLIGFQRREFDLERRVLDLERELEERQRTHEEETLELSEELEERCATLSAQLEDTVKELAATTKGKDATEDALSKLRIEHNALVASTSSSATNLERTSLHLDGLKSSYAELEAKHAEGERTIADLRRQLEKWRTLESREGAEMDTLRRSRIELEVRVKELETRVEELEEELRERVENAEKLKAKIARYKTSFEQYRTSMDEYQKAIDEARSDADKAEAEAEEVNARLVQAEAQLQALRVTSNVMMTGKASPADSAFVPPSISDHEGEDAATADERAPPSPSPPAPPRKPKIQHQSVAATSRQINGSDDDDVVMVEPDSPPKTQEVKRKRGRPRKKRPEEDEVEVVAKPATDRKGKRKVNDTHESDDEPPLKKNKGKTKDKDEVDDDDEEPPKAKAKAKKPAASATLNKGKPGRKASVSIAAPAPAVDGDDEEHVPTPVKKKRKINLFPSSQPVSFDWNQLPQGGGGLDIPKTLSPVKETDTVPPRSVFGGRGSSAFGSFGSLGGRR